MVAYDTCDEDYWYSQRTVHNIFPKATIGRIENNLIKLGYISEFFYDKKQKRLRLNFKK